MTMNGLKIFTLRLTLTAMATAMSFSVLGFAQARISDQEDLLAIPAAQKLTFQKKLDRFVKLQGEHRWGLLFDLSIERIEEKELTKNEFVAKLQSVGVAKRISRIIKFEPSSAVLTNNAGGTRRWLVEGCGTFLRRGRLIKARSGLNAYLVDGNWYFSLLSSLSQIDTPDEHCKQIAPHKASNRGQRETRSSNK